MSPQEKKTKTNGCVCVCVFFCTRALNESPAVWPIFPCRERSAVFVLSFSLSLSLLFYKIKKRNQRDRIHVIHTFMCFSMALLSIAPDFPAPASFFTVPEPEQKKRSATC